MLALLIVLCFSSNRAFTLFCSDLLQIPDDEPFSAQQIESMPDKEIVKCLSHLGKVRMSPDVANMIWQSLKDHYGDVGEIPEEKLNQLHWVTSAVEPEEYENMTITSIDTVENFGLFYDLSEEQLSAIANKVRQGWGDKSFEDYSSYDLTALKQIVCAFNGSDIERIHPEAYRDAAEAFKDLQKCPQEVLKALAVLAVNEDAFGSPTQWNASTKKKVGVVRNGLEVIGSLENKPVV